MGTYQLHHAPYWGVLLFLAVSAIVIITAGGDDQRLVLLRERRFGHAAVNLVGAIAVAFVLVINLSRGEPIACKDETLPDRPPEDDPGLSALEGCYSRLDKLEGELKLVVDAAKRKIDKAAEKAPNKPPSPSGMRRFKDFLGGAGDTVGGWYEGFDDLVHDGPDGVGLRLAGTIDGAAYAAQHPKEFAKAAVNWDEWQKNPARAAGQLTPEILLALATGGAGTARRGASAAKSAAQRLASRERGLRRDGSARKHADNDREKRCVSNGEKKCEGDPIDVATGKMVMFATDVTLPGALPLVLERHYVSGHSCGGWFGRTWAGTLDQRLELDDKGVVYIADDGMLLTYPVPQRDVPVLPTHGPRWPLHWDGKPDGTFTVTAPERNPALRTSSDGRPGAGPDRDHRPHRDRRPHRHRLRLPWRADAGHPLRGLSHRRRHRPWAPAHHLSAAAARPGA